MDWVGLSAAALPPALFLAAAGRHRGFSRQPRLVGAGRPERFPAEVEAAGGAGSVRSGVGLDLGFIATLTVPSGVLLSRSKRPWLVGFAVAAAAFDLVEDVQLLLALRDPSRSRLLILRRTAQGKYAAYAALGVAVVSSVVGS